MQIIDRTQAGGVLAPQSCQYIPRGGKAETRTEPVLRETLLTVTVNGQKAWRIVCLAEHLPELVLGRLLTEGVITAAEDVVRLELRADGTAASELRMAAEAEDEPVLSAGIGVNAKPLPRLESIPWRAEWIFALADRFAEGMPLHEATFATHSALLGSGGRLLFACEDIGRHNALDKAVGFALRNDIPLGGCYLYSSGRIPTDMVSKAIRAGVPILASKAAPTAEAAELARERGLTLICAARRDRMKLLCGRAPE